MIAAIFYLTISTSVNGSPLLGENSQSNDGGGRNDRGTIGVSSMFERLQWNSFPFYRCDDFSGGLKYRINEPINCEFFNEHETVKAIHVGLWVKNITRQAFSAHECFVERTILTKTHPWLGSLNEWVSKERQHIPLSKCKSIIDKKTDPDTGDALEYIGNGEYATKRYPVVEMNWRSEKTGFVDNYGFRTLTVYAFDRASEVHAMIRMREVCKVFAGSCESERGILVWNPDDVPLCRMKLHKTAIGIMSSSGKLTIPEEQMSIPKLEVAFKCGLQVAISRSGMVITQNSIGNFKEHIATTADFKSATIAGGSMRRKRRSWNVRGSTQHLTPKLVDFVDFNEWKPTPGIQTEINSKLEFISDLMFKNTSSNVKLLEYQICMANKRIIEDAKIQASSGNPEVMARTLLGDRTYVAQLSGDALSVWKCRKIHQYQLLVKPTDACYEEWPLRYLDGDTIKFGYLTGISHRIVDTAYSITNCSDMEFYLNVGDRTFQLGNNSFEVKYPALQVRSSSVKISDFPKFSYDRPGQYSRDELSSFKSLYQLMRDKFLREDRVKARRQTRPTKLDPWGYGIWDEFAEYFFGKFKRITTIFLFGVTCFFFVYLFVYPCVFKGHFYFALRCLCGESPT